MSFISIKRPVIVKVIMTENFRGQLISEAEITIADIKKNIEALEKIPQKIPAEGQLNLNDLKKLKDELEWKIKEFQQVKVDTELPFRVFEGTVDLKIGDNFLEKVTKAEVVIKDWKVIEIRQG